MGGAEESKEDKEMEPCSNAGIKQRFYDRGISTDEPKQNAVTSRNK